MRNTLDARGGTVRRPGIRWATLTGATLFAGLLFPQAALADMGPVTDYVKLGITVVVLIEVLAVAVETPVLQWLLGINWRRALVAALAGNLVSALLGLPAAFVIGNLAGGALDSGSLFLAPVAAVLVSFLCSSLVEWPVVKLVTKAPCRRTVVAVLIANAASHILLLGAAWALYNR